MVRPILIIGAAIPVIMAALIAGPMLLNPQVPFSAVNSDDYISIELIKYDLKKISFGLTDKLALQKSQTLTISNDGAVKYTFSDPTSQPIEKSSTIDKSEVKRLTALFKETGFMQLPIDSISEDDSATHYTKYSLKVILNGKTKQLQWPEQNATSTQISPLIQHVESELDTLINKTSAN